MVFSGSWSGLEGQGGFHLLNQYFIKMTGRLGSANPVFIHAIARSLGVWQQHKQVFKEVGNGSYQCLKVSCKHYLCHCFFLKPSTEYTQVRREWHGFHLLIKGTKKYMVLCNPAYSIGVLFLRIGYPTLIVSKLMDKNS